jgi:hypothetical protein
MGKYSGKLVEIVEKDFGKSLSSFDKDRLWRDEKSLNEGNMTCKEAAEKIGKDFKLYLKSWELEELREKLENMTY